MTSYSNFLYAIVLTLGILYFFDNYFTNTNIRNDKNSMEANLYPSHTRINVNMNRSSADSRIQSQNTKKFESGSTKKVHLSLEDNAENIKNEELLLAVSVKFIESESIVNNFPKEATKKVADKIAKKKTYKNQKNNIKKHSTHLNNLKVCPSAVSINYHKADDKNGAESLQWCNSAKNKYGVSLGRSWGSLPGNMREIWEKSKCNELVAKGKLQSCHQRWGWGMFDDWLMNSKAIITGMSTMACATNLKTSVFCKLNNVVVDFSKAHIQGNTRSFSSGFLKTYGTRLSPESPVVGHLHVPTTTTSSTVFECTEWEHRPTYFISHDDIFNLGHHINDVVMLWAMVVLSGRKHSDALLINMDGIRSGGPAGGPSHRLMVASDPDAFGPYVGYYTSWFNDIKRAVDYKSKSVCFSEVYFQPFPGVPWFWNDWGMVNDCSLQASSPLYQSFNVYMRQRWEEDNGPRSLPPPSEDHVLVVIEARSINRSKTNSHSVARHISNLDALVKELSNIPGTIVKAQDFAKLPFKEQIALAHSAGVILSMHGAGTTHLFHMALGRPNCCALVELQPDHSIGFQTAMGFANLARMHGLHYFRYEASDGRTGSTGTDVDITLVKELVVAAVDAVKTQTTCLHDVRDTSEPVYIHSIDAKSIAVLKDTN